MILVTGGTGLVGAHLLYELSKETIPIRAIYRNLDNLKITQEIFKYHGDIELKQFNTIQWVIADITNIPELTNAFKNITHVYHCAAKVSFLSKDEFLLRKINIEGTTNIVNLCLELNIKKLCYISSIATLSPKTNNKEIDENNEWNPELPHSDYSITKFGAEMEVWRASQEGLSVVILNPGVILGSGNWNANTGKFFQHIFKKNPFYTDGSTGFVAVEDVVNASILLMNSRIQNERFVLVGYNLSYLQLFKIIATYFNINIPFISVPKWLAYLSLYISKTISFISFQKINLISEYSMKAAYKKQKYNGSLISKSLNFNYTPIEISIQKITQQFKKSL